jgi:hypothetical protein
MKIKELTTMAKENKEWKKPELIVLTRNKPEESVLATCKSNSGGSNPANVQAACYGNTVCNDCLTVADS